MALGRDRTPVARWARPGSGGWRGGVSTWSWTSRITPVVYGFLGLIVLLIGYDLYERITPWSVKEEPSSRRNPAVAMVIAASILGMAIVIAAALI
jgi:putative membrane protein